MLRRQAPVARVRILVVIVPSLCREVSRWFFREVTTRVVRNKSCLSSVGPSSDDFEQALTKCASIRIVI